MLTRIRIEVEEQTLEAAADALDRYEHAVVAAEAQRYQEQWPMFRAVGGSGEEPEPERSTFTKWDMPMEKRDYFANELGREITDEVIELAPEIPGYRGRRVVRYVRMDTRLETFLAIKPTPGFFEFNVSSSLSDVRMNSGTSN